jgi:hypothetical protein
LSIEIRINTAGFRAKFVERIEMQPWPLREVIQPPLSSKQPHDDRDPDPCPPEDEELLDAMVHQKQRAWKGQSASLCMAGLESQERSGFDDIHRLIKHLPVHVTKAIRLMMHAQAIETQLLSNITEEEQTRFSPSELL